MKNIQNFVLLRVPPTGYFDGGDDSCVIVLFIECDMRYPKLNGETFYSVQVCDGCTLLS